MIRIVGTALYQWDTGRYVTTDIEADHVHFSNKGDSKAVIMDLDDSQSKIPDYLLQTGKQLCVYVVRNGITVESKVFSVNYRERPENYIYEEDQRNFVYALIDEAKAAAEAANQAAEAATQSTGSANQAAAAALTAALKAGKAVDGANQAAENANGAAAKAAQTAKSLMVVGGARGTAIHLDDSIDQYLVGLRVFGKTTQNGVPTPEVPVALVSAADGGDISIHVCGKNLFTGWIVGGISPGDGADYAVTTQRRTPYIPISSPGQKYRISNIPATLYSLVAFYDADKKFIVRSAAAPRNWMLVEPPENAKYFRLTSYENPEVTGKIAEADAMASITMIEEGTTATEYEAGKQIQTATISAPNGLPGIPVTTGGNYTDASGQQWICDEIDFARGVYVQRCDEIVIDSATGVSVGQHGNLQRFCTRAVSDIVRLSGAAPKMVLCDRYEATGWTDQNNKAYCIGSSIVLTDNRFTDQATTVAILQAEKPKVVYVLAAPIETPLPENELAAYAALHTYKDNTTVSNDAGAYMELEYVMDAKKYIDGLITGTIVPATVE